MFIQQEDSNKTKDLSNSILQGLKTVCLDNEDEKLYIANSQSVSMMIV